MITINENTKIASILKEGPAALDAIISINPKFAVLRNPMMRRLMAGRTSIGMASKIGGCSVQSFFDKLEPFGFVIDRTVNESKESKKQNPGFISSLKKEQLINLDVRPILSEGKDCLNIILQKVNALQPGQVLKVINSFEPTPLIQLLDRRGFSSYVEVVHHNLIHTYFYRRKEEVNVSVKHSSKSDESWEQVLKRFAGAIQLIDVRQLEMPQPMIRIIAALQQLPEGMALFVCHKRIPVFLLPELDDRHFEYRIKEISDNEVHLLIFK